jgi:hypothetical protein
MIALRGMSKLFRRSGIEAGGGALRPEVLDPGQVDAALARALADFEARIARASRTRPHTVTFTTRKGV